MENFSFIDLLNCVSPDRSFDHLSPNGLCDLIFRWSTSPYCDFIGSDHFDILARFYPTDEDIEVLRNGSYDTMYWGSESDGSNGGFLTPLRETILLFCAAINDEL